MSLRVKHLNADSSFLLIFTPPIAPYSPQGTFPGSFTILVDPWLTGPSTIWNSRFALTTHTHPACIESLAELPDPDLVLVSQDKSDHCHRETLTQLPPETAAMIVATSSAAKKIKSWDHFEPSSVFSLDRYSDKDDSSVFRIAIPAFSESGTPGEVTLALLTSKNDLSGLHNAIGITYRPPASVLSANVGSCINLPSLTPPPTPPHSPHTSLNSMSSTNLPLSIGAKERTVSVLYSPHGVDYSSVKPYATSHLLSESALPLTTLMHSFNKVANPWFLGGNICAGMSSGVEIARNLYAKSWIGAHDEDKHDSGVAVRFIKKKRFELDEIRDKLQGGASATTKNRNNTALIELEAGEEYYIAGK